MKAIGIALMFAAVGVGACDKATPDALPVSAAATAAPANAGQSYASVYNSLSKAATGIDVEQGGYDAVLQEHAPQIEQLIEQSKANDADFGVNYEEGLITKLPHLGQMRAFGRLLTADAKRAIAAGDMDGACKRIAATIRLATQITKPAQSQIELLVAIAFVQLSAKQVIENPGLAKAAWKTDIQNAIVSASDAVVTRSSEVIKRELDATIRDLRANKIPNLSSAEWGSMGKNWPAATAAEREEAAKNIEAFEKEMRAAWHSQGATDKIKSMVQAREGKPGVDLIESLWRTRKSVEDAKEQLAKAASALSK